MMPLKKIISLFSETTFAIAFFFVTFAGLISFNGCSSSISARANENNHAAGLTNNFAELKSETQTPSLPFDIGDAKTAGNAHDLSIGQTALTLYDFRLQPTLPPPQKIGNVEQNAVWKYVYGAGRKMEIGEFVDERLSGSFTASGVKETLYVVRGNQSANDPPTETTFAIYNGTTPVTKLKVLGKSVLKVTDINADGKNELFLTTGDISNGSSDLDAAIVQISNGQIEILKKFPSVFSSTDSFDHGQTGAEVEVIKYVPAASGEFPAKYSIARFSCSGSEGEVNPKTCRPAKAN